MVIHQAHVCLNFYVLHAYSARTPAAPESDFYGPDVNYIHIVILEILVSQSSPQPAVCTMDQCLKLKA
jgi:hypothetical protein